jgi:hypothetical protein
MTRSAPVRIEVPGEAKLRRDFDDARRELENLDAAHDATARRVLPRVRTRAPRLTGALGASMTADVAGGTVGFTSALPYFGVIHQGWPERGIEANPFAVDAVVEAEAEVVDVYADHIDATLSRQFETRY